MSRFQWSPGNPGEGQQCSGRTWPQKEGLSAPYTPTPPLSNTSGKIQGSLRTLAFHSNGPEPYCVPIFTGTEEKQLDSHLISLLMTQPSQTHGFDPKSDSGHLRPVTQHSITEQSALVPAPSLTV